MKSTCLNRRKYMMTYLTLLLLLDLILLTDGMCKFQDYLSSCHHIINDEYPADITAVLNSCNDPIDISFNIRSPQYGVNWEHTFVNKHEVQRIHGFPKEVLFHVIMEKFDRKNVHIEAEFHVDAVPGHFIINSSVPIASSYSCNPMSTGAGTATLVVFIIILLALVTSVPFIIWWRRRQHRRTTNALVENMEQVSSDRIFKDKGVIEIRESTLDVIEEENSSTGTKKKQLRKKRERKSRHERQVSRKNKLNLPDVTVTRRSEEVKVDANALREFEIP